jgi:hypothetical protein
MFLKGGYFMVDATGYDYSKTSAQTVTGLYAQCDKAYKSGKPIILYGWNYNNVVMSPMMVYVLPSTNSYIIDGKIKVTNADSVAPVE